MSIRYLVDTNVLLRFLSGEPRGQAAAAATLFQDAASGKVVLDLPSIIIAEAYYTLTSFYQVERKDAAEKLLALVQSRGIRVRERSVVIDALERLGQTNVGFADAFLAALGAQETVTIASFDRDLDKFKDVNRFEPQP